MDSISHCPLGSPISVSSQEYNPQTHPQVIPVETVSQLRLPVFRYVKLTSESKNDNLHDLKNYKMVLKNNLTKWKYE